MVCTGFRKTSPGRRGMRVGMHHRYFVPSGANIKCVAIDNFMIAGTTAA